MITSSLIYFFEMLLAGVLTLFPTMESMPSGVADAFTTAGTVLGTASAIFPVSDLLTALTFVLLLEAGIWTVRTLVFVAGFVRGGH